MHLLYYVCVCTYVRTDSKVSGGYFVCVGPPLFCDFVKRTLYCSLLAVRSPETKLLFLSSKKLEVVHQGTERERERKLRKEVDQFSDRKKTHPPHT